MVTGTVAHASQLETGVTVNGAAALIYENEFVANHVPLGEGENTIQVEAVDIDKYVKLVENIVYANVGEDYIRLDANPGAGLAPLG